MEEKFGALVNGGFTLRDLSNSRSQELTSREGASKMTTNNSKTVSASSTIRDSHRQNIPRTAESHNLSGLDTNSERTIRNSYIVDSPVEGRGAASRRSSSAKTYTTSTSSGSTNAASSPLQQQLLPGHLQHSGRKGFTCERLALRINRKLLLKRVSHILKVDIKKENVDLPGGGSSSSSSYGEVTPEYLLPFESIGDINPIVKDVPLLNYLEAKITYFQALKELLDKARRLLILRLQKLHRWLKVTAELLPSSQDDDTVEMPNKSS